MPPAGIGSQNEISRYASVATAAAAPPTPARASIPVSPASTKPSPPGVSGIIPRNEAAKETYPDGWESPKPYIRIVPQPS